MATVIDHYIMVEAKVTTTPRCHDNSRGGGGTGENEAWKPGWIEKPEAMETRYRPHLTDCN